jgi:DNA-binding NtrC family response regulator
MVFLDMILPSGLDGLETYRLILQHHPQQRVVLMSGYFDETMMRKAKSLGATEFLPKPFNSKEMEMVINEERNNVKRP